MQPEKGKSIPLCATDTTRDRAKRAIHSTLILEAFLQDVNRYVLISERAPQNRAGRRYAGITMPARSRRYA
jgi:hypothetical protein